MRHLGKLTLMTVLLAVCAAAYLCVPASASANAFNFTELTVDCPPPFFPAGSQCGYLPPSNDAGKSVVTGDYNHDGHVDIAFDNSSGQNSENCPFQGCVSILLGKGDVTFNGPTNYPTGGNPNFGSASLAQGDFNGDGNLDLVVANVPPSGCDGCASILYGNGDGTFGAPDTVPANLFFPEAVAVGDFNGDGRPDIAVGDSGDQSVTILLNQGNDSSGHATFAPAPGSPFPLASGFGPIDGMTVADMTGHGKIDLVLSTGANTFGGPETCATSNCVQVLTNTHDGSGNFNSAVAYPVDGVSQVAVGDLTGNGLDDVLVPGGNGFQVLLNQGSGTLGQPQSYDYPGAGNPHAITVGDFNHDGKLDAAVADFSSNITVLFEGHGDGTFTYDDTVNDPNGAQSTDDALATGDFNGDCKPDLALGSDDGLIVMRNDTGPSGSVCPPPPPPATTTTTPPTVTPASPPPSTKPHVGQTIHVTGGPAKCTTGTVRLHVRIALSPPAVASRRGRLAVKTRTIVKLDGHRMGTHSQRRFTLIIETKPLRTGVHRVTLTVTSSGIGVVGSHRTRLVHFARCAATARFTG